MQCECPNHQMVEGKFIPCTNQARVIWRDRYTDVEYALCSDCHYDRHVFVRSLVLEEVMKDLE